VEISGILIILVMKILMLQQQIL